MIIPSKRKTKKSGSAKQRETAVAVEKDVTAMLDVLQDFPRNSSIELQGNVIGLDEVNLKTPIKKIDWNKLRLHSNVEFRKAKRSYRVWDNISVGDEKFYRTCDQFVIRDNNKIFNFAAGVTDCVQSLWVKMTLTVHHMRGDNGTNASKEEYDAYLTVVKAYLKDKYGVEIEIDAPKIGDMEINGDIKLKNPFAAYGRVFNVLMEQRNARFADIKKFDHIETDQNYTNYYEWKNKSWAIRLYCKTLEQASHGEKAKYQGDIARIEIKLLNSKKIREVFGTDEWNKITSADLAEAFSRLFYDTYLKPKIKIWLKESKEFIKNMVKDVMANGKYRSGWELKLAHNIMMHEINTKKVMVLDRSQIYRELETYTDQSRNIGKKKKRFEELNRNHSHPLFQADLVWEIISQIDEIYQRSKIIAAAEIVHTSEAKESNDCTTEPNVIAEETDAGGNDLQLM